MPSAVGIVAWLGSKLVGGAETCRSNCAISGSCAAEGAAAPGPPEGGRWPRLVPGAAAAPGAAARVRAAEGKSASGDASGAPAGAAGAGRPSTAAFSRASSARFCAWVRKSRWRRSSSNDACSGVAAPVPNSPIGSTGYPCARISSIADVKPYAIPAGTSASAAAGPAAPAAAPTGLLPRR